MTIYATELASHKIHALHLINEVYKEREKKCS